MTTKLTMCPESKTMDVNEFYKAADVVLKQHIIPMLREADNTRNSVYHGMIHTMAMDANERVAMYISNFDTDAENKQAYCNGRFVDNKWDTLALQYVIVESYAFARLNRYGTYDKGVVKGEDAQEAAGTEEKSLLDNLLIDKEQLDELMHDIRKTGNFGALRILAGGQAVHFTEIARAIKDKNVSYESVSDGAEMIGEIAPKNSEIIFNLLRVIELCNARA